MTWLRFLAIVACCAGAQGGLVKIRVDDEVKVYLDGEVVSNEFVLRGWQWRKLVDIPFSDNSSIMALRMYNQGPRRLGYAVGEIDGKDLFSSGIVCKDVPKKQDPDAFFPGWFEENYDDSDWTPPKAVESHPTEGILADAQGFWGVEKSSRNVLCRLKLTINACEPNPCQNGGVCKDFVNTYMCECTPGYGGESCETYTNVCDPNPCQNGGTCHDLGGSYKCECLYGTAGINCEVHTMESAYNGESILIKRKEWFGEKVAQI